MICKAIFFDLDGTLYDLHPTYADHLFDCMASQGIELQPGERKHMERWIHWYWGRHPRQSLQDSHATLRDDLLISMFNGFGRPLSPQKSHQIAEQFLCSFALVPTLMPGSLNLLKELRRRKILVGVLTNRGELSHQELEALGILDLLDVILTAGSLGFWKPQCEFFVEALRRTNQFPPEQVLCIGDNYFADIVGATSAGIKAVLFDCRRIYDQVDCPVIYHMDDVLKVVETAFPGEISA